MPWPTPSRDMPLDGKTGRGKLLARDQHGIDRDDLIHVAMDQEDRRTVAGA